MHFSPRNRMMVELPPAANRSGNSIKCLQNASEDWRGVLERVIPPGVVVGQ